MADEPRRSGRATKGQHTKLPEESAEPPVKAKGKPRKKQQQQPEEEDDANEQVRCLCGIGEDEDDEGRAFTCCDNCNVWQHNDCMGLPLKYNPAQYFCEQCRPEDHPVIAEALQRGESAQDIAARLREEVHSRRKGGRKSKGPRVSEVREEPVSAPAPEAAPAPAVAPTPTEQNKRKQTSETPSAQPSKLRKASTHITEDVSGSAKGSRKQTADSLKLAETLTELKNAGRQNTAAALKKKFAQAVKEQSSKGVYRIPDGDTPDSLGERNALVVEYAMFMNHCGTSHDPTPAYKDQFRNITSNIGPNPSLLLDLLDGKLTADALSTMSSSDMATDEQKKRDKEIKEENERLAMLKEDETAKRRIRRTHKGEEYIDDDQVMIDNDGVNTHPPPQPQLQRVNSITGNGNGSGSSNAKAASPGAEQPRPPRISTERSQFGAQEDARSPSERRTSSHFNLQNVWSSVQSPGTGDARPPSHHQQPQPQPLPPRHGPRQNDADLDRLLEDDADPDSAPYSPTDAGMDPGVIWRGKVDISTTTSNIASFDAHAYHVAGTDFNDRERLVNCFPRDIALGGRIAVDKADEYLSSLSAAYATDVTVLDLVPPANSEKGQSEFNTLFDYLLERKRWGVLKDPYNPPVRDVYIVPLEKGTAPKPIFLQKLADDIVENDRKRRMILIVFVLRYKNTPSHSAQATPTVPVPSSAMSPTVSSGPGPAQQQQMSVSAPSQGAVRAAPPNGQPQQSLPFPPSAGAPAAVASPQQIPDNPYAPQPAGATQTSQPPLTFPLQQVSQPHQLPQSQAQSQPPQHDLARQILGPYFDTPTAVQIIHSQAAIPTETLQKLRKVFDDHPETRTDFDAFQRALSKGS